MRFLIIGKRDEPPTGLFRQVFEKVASGKISTPSSVRLLGVYHIKPTILTTTEEYDSAAVIEADSEEAARKFISEVFRKSGLAVRSFHCKKLE